ncbi:MEDS domain-containing protein [Streptomyces sp. ISL-87]|nr:MEDS domain-containing protein [Streptomyces sp. ISL-21]MBT2455944.1 MEDS domain-containing protein [Streptomyces sp. ISL-86]MBT2611333.1 MEDS domain-containing protein [Streptomyces sp. ISL-87]
MRGMRALATLDEVEVGDHVCWVIDDARGLATDSAPFVADGALFGDRLVLVGAPGPLAEVRKLRAFPSSAVVIDPFETAGSIVSAVYQELKRASREGFRSVRVLACRGSGGDASPGMPALLESELGLDEVAALSGATVVCAYLPGTWDAAELEQVMCVHPQTLGNRPELPGFHMFRSGSEGWKVTGVIDSDGAHAFGSVLRAAALHTPAIRLRFEDVELIDAAGMRALVDAALHLPDRTITVEGANRIVRLSWQLSGYSVPEVPVEVLG